MCVKSDDSPGPPSARSEHTFQIDSWRAAAPTVSHDMFLPQAFASLYRFAVRRLFVDFGRDQLIGGARCKFYASQINQNITHNNIMAKWRLGLGKKTE